MSPGDRVRIGIHRDGRPREVTVRLEELPYSGGMAAAPARQPRAADKIGVVELIDLTPELAEQAQLESAEGVVVVEVQPNGPAAGRGIGSGCVITEVDRAAIRDVDDVRDALADVERECIAVAAFQCAIAPAMDRVTLGSRLPARRRGGG